MRRHRIHVLAAPYLVAGLGLVLVLAALTGPPVDAAESDQRRFGKERDCTGEGTCLPSGLARGTLAGDNPGTDCIYEVSIDWGDGNVSEYRLREGAVSHQYEKPGIYTQSATGSGSSASGEVCTFTPTTFVYEVPAPAEALADRSTASSADDDEGGGSSTGVIVGAALGVLVLVAVGVLLMTRRRRAPRRADQMHVVLRPDQASASIEGNGPLESIAIRLDGASSVVQWREGARR